MVTKLILLFSMVFLWLGLNGLKFDISLLAPILTYYIIYKLSLLPNDLRLNFFRTLKYFVWLVREIILSTIAVSKLAWRRNVIIIPTIKTISSSHNDEMGIVMYANSITLTPGTVTLSAEGNKLLIHALDIKFMDDLEQGDMDERVKSCCI